MWLCGNKTNIVRLRPAWIQTSLRIRAVWSGSMLFAVSFSTCIRVGKRTAWILIRLRGCAGLSGSMLVTNPLCWFCRDAAHIRNGWMWFISHWDGRMLHYLYNLLHVYFYLLVGDSIDRIHCIFITHLRIIYQQHLTLFFERIDTTAVSRKIRKLIIYFKV
jgi:hypothetical protein